MTVVGGTGEFGNEGGEKVGGGGAGGGELRFQRVYQCHQLLYFCHDQALFGEGWEWCCKVSQRAQGDSRLSRARCAGGCLFVSEW